MNIKLSGKLNVLQFRSLVQKQSNVSYWHCCVSILLKLCVRAAGTEHSLSLSTNLNSKAWVCASHTLRIKFLLRLSRLIPAPVRKGTNCKNIYSGSRVGKDWMKDFFFYTLDCWEMKLTVVNEIFQIFLFFGFFFFFWFICEISSGAPGLKVANEFQKMLLVRLLSILQSDLLI